MTAVSDVPIQGPVQAADSALDSAVIDRCLAVLNGRPAAMDVLAAATALSGEPMLPAGLRDRVRLACPRLLGHAATPAEQAASIALTATLAPDPATVRPHLLRLARSEDPRIAVAAHLTALLADGAPPSRQHLEDVLLVVAAQVTRDELPGLPPREAAVTAVHELAAIVL